MHQHTPEHKHSSCSHGHHHHPVISGYKLAVTVIINLLITVAQVIGGILSGSVALLSDALHNFSDVISLMLSFVANRMAAKKPSGQNTYGFKRVEVLAAFINAGLLIAIAIALIVGALERLDEHRVIDSNLVIYFALGSILLNFFCVLILKKDASDSLNIKSAYLHLLTDVFTSISVLIGGVLMKYYQIYYIDRLLSIAIALYLIYSSFGLLKETSKILLQIAPSTIPVGALNDEIVLLSFVKEVQNAKLWQLNENDIYYEAHIVFEENVNLESFAIHLKVIQDLLNEKGVKFATIQPSC